MFALKFSQQRLFGKWKQLIYGALCWLFSACKNNTTGEYRNVNFSLSTEKCHIDFLLELFVNSISSSFVTNHKSSVKNLNLVLGCQAVKLQYTKKKYLSTYWLCFWNRNDVFQRNSIQLPQHYLCLRLEDSRNKLLIYLQYRVVMLCSKSRPLSF